MVKANIQYRMLAIFLQKKKEQVYALLYY